MANGHTKRGFTCEGICIFVTAAQVYPARIFFNELCDLVDICKRKVVLFKKSPSSGECIFCKCVTHTILTQETKTKRTIGVVWKLERGDPILDVNVKDVVILLSLVKLLASRTNSIDDLPDLLPLITRTVPLIESLVKFYALEEMKRT